MANNKSKTADLTVPGRLAGLARLAQETNRQSREDRYRFGTISLAECQFLQSQLQFLGAGQHDVIYAALSEHIARREAREGRSAPHGRAGENRG